MYLSLKFKQCCQVDIYSIHVLYGFNEQCTDFYASKILKLMCLRVEAHRYSRRNSTLHNTNHEIFILICTNNASNVSNNFPKNTISRNMFMQY